MNYRHAFHAGGPADVVKHAVLARIILYLRAKPAAFRVIDSHAGPGRYDLHGPEATRSPEWRLGIARLMAQPLEPAVAALLAPYLDAVKALNPAGALAIYPGSPLVARALMRNQDRLTACELAPDAASALAHHLAGDRRAKAVAIDGWSALNAYLPPPERRGVVLIDPPFEASDELARLAQALEGAHRKWPTGIFLVWYPTGGRQDAGVLTRRLQRVAIHKVLQVELAYQATADRRAGCGLIAVNPPFTLAGELEILLPALAAAFAGSHRLVWLSPGA